MSFRTIKTKRIEMKAKSLLKPCKDDSSCFGIENKNVQRHKREADFLRIREFVEKHSRHCEYTKTCA